MNHDFFYWIIILILKKLTILSYYCKTLVLWTLWITFVIHEKNSGYVYQRDHVSFQMKKYIYNDRSKRNQTSKTNKGPEVTTRGTGPKHTWPQMKIIGRKAVWEKRGSFLLPPRHIVVFSKAVFASLSVCVS